MAARITRKQLKTDRFAVEIEHTVDYFAEHRTRILQLAAVGAAVALIIIAAWLYVRRQRAVREQALADAIQIEEAPAGPANQSGGTSYPTEDAKRQAALKAFSAIAANHAGSKEGQVAEYYLGGIALDNGKMADAEKYFKQAADGGDRNYGSLAKLALAQIYFSTNRGAQGESLLRDLMNHPTDLVSKEQATFALARGIAPSRPNDARKLLEPLRSQPGAVSQQAMNAIAELPAQ